MRLDTVRDLFLVTKRVAHKARPGISDILVPDTVVALSTIKYMKQQALGL